MSYHDKRDCKYCPDKYRPYTAQVVHHNGEGEGSKCDNPNTQVWSASDYNYSTGVQDNVNFAVKSTSFDSPMALGGTAYRAEPWKPDYQPRYYLHEASTTYPPGVFVPSGFDWNRGIDYWYNDLKYEIGQFNYPVIIAGFGHTHILTVQAAIRVKMQNMCADVSDLMSQFTSMRSGSTDIFLCFAQLVDAYSNPIAYDPNTPSGKLKQLTEMLIKGPDNIDVEWLAQKFRNFLSNYFPNGQPELYGYIDQMVAYVKKCMYGDTIFKSWNSTMEEHADCMFMGFEMYTEYYKHKCNPKIVKKLNSFCRKFLLTGEYLAAFFGVFLFCTVILDRALTIMGSPTTPAIPTDKVSNILNYILSNQLAAWRQHIWGFLDYDMVAANKCFPNQLNKLFEIQTTMLETCNPLACFIGKIMFSYDRLVRGRNLYASLG